MFVDILGRIQQWSGLVQNKLDICNNEIETLREELIARACEIENLKNLLGECEKERAAALIQAAKAQEEAIQIEKIEIICTDAAIQSILKDKEKRREIELEGEIARLRKENERIIKERAEYENAIQRALLRGVSSLNVEALKVLRCPPIPCCTPCAPCPASAIESVVPCAKKGTASTGIAKNCGTKRIGNGSTVHEENCTVKRPCASPCCSAGKSRQSAMNNSTIFLLHQGDTENICGSNNVSVPICGSPVMKKIEIPPCPRFTI
ncbi:uncharacterized protein LOC122720614 [Apis laboriosa]|uniref:uncharacterized protein LOC122720614 n=1 Tax=Apis laboriosa TaxID=183418 RepID=UPI001CC62624|nr:uncharacterized protein LOC122720614 [Apis laboriosa]